MRTLLILLLILSSCGGTRNRVVHVSAEKRNVVITENKDIKTNVKTTRTATEVFYEPIDPDKPMTLPDGRKTSNAKVKEVSKSETKDEQGTDKTKTDIAIDIDKKDKDIDLETKRPNPWLWPSIVVGTIGIVFVLVYFGKKR